ncbi:uncharacterized protein [Eurosta solidaginis]|uniref:uncharacterized protein n=1 Tax=Eurosta solidaginis TaxID=178769 RepID=UPI003530CD23
MESAETKSKCDRATREQLEHYVFFYSANPEMGSGKNNPRSPQQMRSLWAQLAEELNALRGPTRSAEKWKETLGVWKSQLRTRARRIKMSQRVTGGGPQCKSLNEFEDRALATFGLLAVDGAGLGSSGLNSPPQELPARTSSIFQSPSPAESDTQSPSRILAMSPSNSPTILPQQNHASDLFVAMWSPSSPETNAESASFEPSMPGMTPLEPETENAGVLNGSSVRMSRAERSKLISTLMSNISKRNSFEERRERREEEQRQEHRETIQAITISQL